MLHRLHRVDADIFERARAMRREAAPAERVLWHCLRNRRLNGIKFRRQSGMSRFVVDFYCAECSLIVEADGASHADQAEYDERRTQRLGERGCDVIRYENSDIFDHLDAVLDAILRECEARSKRPPKAPPPAGDLAV